MTTLDALNDARDWWSTEIIDMHPGSIRFRGYPIEDLIGRVSFAAMIWLMLRGELPSPAQEQLLNAALVSGVDHGPQAPSIAVARMVMTCGVGINNAMASAINSLGDVHGGAGEQCVELYLRARALREEGNSSETASVRAMDEFFATGERFLPGFGHRFHPVDPRAPRLLGLVEEAACRGEVSGEYASIGRTIEAELKRRKGKLVPMNIDGATAVIYAELGFASTLARGLFVLSRSVGILAHAWEQHQYGGRNKGPTPPAFLYSYNGVSQRELPP